MRDQTRTLTAAVLTGLLATAVMATAAVIAPLSAAAATLPSNVLSAPGRYIWVDGKRLHIHCSGRGRPSVILDAGLGGTSLEWVRVQPTLSRHTQVCSYDRAGYGWSKPGGQPRTSAVIVEELYRLLGYAGIPGPYLLVGHSFGGLSLRLFAQRFPRRVAGMVMLDSTHELQFADEVTPKSRKSLLPRHDRQFVIGNHWQIPAALPEFYRSTALALARLPDATRALYSELRHLRLSAAQVHAERAALPDVPLTVIAHDSRSRAKTPRAARFAARWMALQRELAGRSSQGLLLIATRSGHHIHLEQPELVSSAVLNMLQRLRRCDTGC